MPDDITRRRHLLATALVGALLPKDCPMTARSRRPLVSPRRCPASRPIGPSACGRILEPGALLCREHAAADPHRVCGAPAGSGSERPPCKAWPIADLPFCALHDPQLREERRLTRESVVGQLTRVRLALRHATAPVLARVIDQLVTSRRVQADDVAALLRTWSAAR